VFRFWKSIYFLYLSIFATIRVVATCVLHRKDMFPLPYWK